MPVMTREQILAQAEKNREAYRSGCNYRRDGKKIERSDFGKWTPAESFTSINAAKRWSREQPKGSVYAV